MDAAVLMWAVAVAATAAASAAALNARPFNYSVDDDQPTVPEVPQERIVGGFETNISVIPYQLALEWNGHQFCSASIMSSIYAISAGHCIYQFEPEEIVVRTGSTSRETGGKVIPIKKFYFYPKYNKTKIDYDVAIIELESSIEFDENSQPIEVTDEEPKAGEKVLVSGWGNLHERGDAPSNLHSLEISVIDRISCKRLYQGIEEITERMICAGAQGFDSCKGDSGGPVAKGKKLVGIVSWGKGCGRAKYPGVYTNLADLEMRKFIRDIIGI